jgi:hypothetical protein
MVVSCCISSLVNELCIKEKSINFPYVQHYKSVFLVHIILDAHDFIILPAFEKC